MRVLVTGGAGFIGSHITDAYIKSGHEVAVADNLSVGKRENVASGAKFYQVDITDYEALKRVVDEFKPEVINHHAAQKSVTASVADPVADATINIIGGLNLLNLAKEYGVKRIIFASTGGAIYGEAKEMPTPETYSPKPEAPYGITKLSFENYLRFFAANFGLKTVILRYSNVYGPRQDPYGEAGVVAIFTKKLLEGKQAVIFGDGEQTRDFVYVADVVEANIKALEKGDSEVINIGTAKEISVNEVYDTINKMIGAGFKARRETARPGELRRSVIDNIKAAKILDWRPKFKFNQGVARTIAWFEKNNR